VTFLCTPAHRVAALWTTLETHAGFAQGSNVKHIPVSRPCRSTYYLIANSCQSYHICDSRIDAVIHKLPVAAFIHVTVIVKAMQVERHMDYRLILALTWAAETHTRIFGTRYILSRVDLSGKKHARVHDSERISVDFFSSDSVPTPSPLHRARNLMIAQQIGVLNVTSNSASFSQEQWT
jgi:hypothetical protein